jgi:phosphonate transport system permease protein
VSDVVDVELRTLRRMRPRSPFLRWSAIGLLALVVLSWASGEFAGAELLSERRISNLLRFLGEIVPFPLQEETGQTVLQWAGGLMTSRGIPGALATLAISVAAIVLAAAAAGLLCLPATRSIASPEPWLPGPRPPGAAAVWAWRALVAVTRTVLIFLRAIPEYVWAYLFLAMLGPTAWPAVLALAVHNAGILGKLGAETVENLERPALASLRALGGTRTQIAAVGILPAALPRLLLYFFYRWESCVREATVLGMLGIVSLGSWIQDARSRQRYDDMLFLILLGAGIVIVGDVVSAVARAWVRRAG